MESKIEVLVKSVYGRELIYPVNAQALIMADFVNAKTFTVQQIKTLKKLGFLIVQTDGFSILNIETILSQKVG